MSNTILEANIAAADTFSDPCRFQGQFNLSISGTINTGTILTVQRSTDGTTWRDVDTFTKASEDVGLEPELMYYRVGCKAGEFQGGDSVDVRIGLQKFTDNRVVDV